MIKGLAVLGLMAIGFGTSALGFLGSNKVKPHEYCEVIISDLVDEAYKESEYYTSNEINRSARMYNRNGNGIDMCLQTFENLGYDISEEGRRSFIGRAINRIKQY
ncbi:hypothetical protein [Billgrantia endophytica]|uniref:hypothetical protein n=1 Tax=Billgrantia endophytica TaxID=2033802 RepID=UPI001055699D|nr:hypothetical protein [Halomonas endophytica]